MSITETSERKQLQSDLIEEIQVVVGINFDSSLIQEHLELNKFDFLETFESLISK